MVDRIDRIKGALIGFACGDAIGATTEFMEPEEIKVQYGVLRDMVGGGWLDLKPGEITDDTQMAFCVARSLAATNGVSDYKDMADRLLEWLDTNPKDVGAACRRGLENYRKTGSLCNGDNETLGNGGLLRVLPFALAGRSWQEAMVHVALTHNADLQYRAVQSYVLAIQAGINGGSKRDIAREIRGIGIRRTGVTNNSGHVRHTLNSALNCFFSNDSFEDTIIQAVNQGRDADSVAAIAGAIAGGYYGYEAIPERWRDTLDRGVHDELVVISCFLSELSY